MTEPKRTSSNTLKKEKIYLVNIETELYHEVDDFPDPGDQEFGLVVSISTRYLGHLEKRIADHYRAHNQRITTQLVTNDRINFNFFNKEPLALIAHVIYKKPIYVLTELNPDNMAITLNSIMEKICINNLKINVDSLFYYLLVVE